MHISIEPSSSGKTFGIAFAKAEGQDPFCVIKGCRVAQTKDGSEFVSGPSSKMDDGKYFNYTFFGKEFGQHVLKLAKSVAGSSKPQAQAPAEDLPF